jgi:hypothetical protein
MTTTNVEWAAILDRIQESIAATLERTPEPMAVATPADPANPAGAHLEALDRRLMEMQSSLERAERCAGEIDATLHSEAEAIGQWNENLDQVRKRLEEWAVPVT